MAYRFDIGDRPVLSGAFTDVAGTPTAPTAVTVTVLDGAGTVTAYSSPHSTIVLGATTTFTFPEVLSVSGSYLVRMTGTAGVQAAAVVGFSVNADRFTG